jgi:hypothetical protein
LTSLNIAHDEQTIMDVKAKQSIKHGVGNKNDKLF